MRGSQAQPHTNQAGSWPRHASVLATVHILGLAPSEQAEVLCYTRAGQLRDRMPNIAWPVHLRCLCVFQNRHKGRPARQRGAPQHQRAHFFLDFLGMPPATVVTAARLALLGICRSPGTGSERPAGHDSCQPCARAAAVCRPPAAATARGRCVRRAGGHCRPSPARPAQ